MTALGGSGPVILLHGFLGSARDWSAVLSHWGLGDQAHLIEIQTSHPDIGSCAAQVAQEIGVIVKRHQGAPTMVGYSMGGRVLLEALALKLVDPRALVLVSSNPGIDDPAERAARAARDQEWGRQLQALGLSAFMERWYSQEIFAPVVKAVSLPRLVSRQSTMGVPQQAGTIAALSPGLAPSRWGAMADNRQKISLIVGGLDGAYAPIAARAKSLGVRVETIAQSGHSIALEQPKALAEVLKMIHEETVP